MTYLDPYQLMQLSAIEKYFVPVTDALYEGSWESSEKDAGLAGGLLDMAFTDKKKYKSRDSSGIEYSSQGVNVDWS
jgi:hypothetical protein